MKHTNGFFQACRSREQMGLLGQRVTDYFEVLLSRLLKAPWATGAAGVEENDSNEERNQERRRVQKGEEKTQDRGGIRRNKLRQQQKN